MKINEANWDRAARVMLGLFILTFASVGSKTPWGLLGLIPIATGLIGFCPLYRMFGFSTCRATHGTK